jgi:lipoprotein-anchoring transpeptidase ErfK/SrfK
MRGTQENRVAALPVVAVVLGLLSILSGGALWALSEEPLAIVAALSGPATATATDIAAPTSSPAPTIKPSPIPTWTPTLTPLPTCQPAATPSPATPTDPSLTPSATPFPLIFHGRWVDVNLTRQVLVAYDGETAVRVTPVSTGKERTPTPTGLFRIHTKLRYDDMRGPDYYLRNVPYVMYFHKDYALHGTYWHTDFGHPASHGCINLPTPEAEWLYDWAAVGTPVNVHE